VSVIVGAVAVAYLAFEHVRASRARAAVTAYEVGDSLPASSLYHFDAQATLVLWVRSSCRFCTDSMEFYRRIVDRQRTVKVIAMGTEDRETLKAYFGRHGVVVDEVISVSPGSLRLFSTPMLLGVTRGGRIDHLWRGRLSSDREADVLAYVR
jgi:hypothetical protein